MEDELIKIYYEFGKCEHRTNGIHNLSKKETFELIGKLEEIKYDLIQILYDQD